MQITNGKLFVVSMNMNRSLSPRSDDYVNVLPKFDSLEGNILVQGNLKTFSVATMWRTSLGLSLLHKHSILEERERLTCIRGTSSPLKMPRRPRSGSNLNPMTDLPAGGLDRIRGTRGS